jgi:hypothetical protein
VDIHQLFSSNRSLENKKDESVKKTCEKACDKNKNNTIKIHSKIIKIK